MIRPRGGSYVFDDAEIAIIIKDVLVCRELGCPGVVTGVQLANGRINTDQMKRIVDLAYPMQLSCHKVFDETPDAFEALENLVEAGCVRVLTSGLQKTAAEGAPLLAKLVDRAAGRITIMPGGTVRSSNIATLAQNTGAKEFHSSGVISRGFVNFSDEIEVRQMVMALQSL
jgi:copper homeostasis protein